MELGLEVSRALPHLPPFEFLDLPGILVMITTWSNHQRVGYSAVDIFSLSLWVLESAEEPCLQTGLGTLLGFSDCYGIDSAEGCFRAASLPPARESVVRCLIPSCRIGPVPADACYKEHLRECFWESLGWQTLSLGRVCPYTHSHITLTSQSQLCSSCCEKQPVSESFR